MWFCLPMTPAPDPAEAAPLPDDVAALKALLLAERATAAKLAGQNEHLRAIVKELRRALFGRRSEKTAHPDQLQLALEDIEQALAQSEAEEERADATLKASRSRQRRVNRGALPKHLPREEIVIEPDSRSCPCCGGTMHRIGEDVAERLDVIPAQFKVIVTRRPRYGCRACESAVVQVPAPARLIEGGLPTEAMIAHVLVGKYADHLPLYRQSRIYARQGIELDRSTLADWVGRAAAELQPVHERLFEHLKRSPKLFMDETRAPVLDPGRGRTKTGYLWAIARDDRPWGGPDPPAVAFLYAPGRGAEHAIRPLAGFAGILQVDAYAAYKALGTIRGLASEQRCAARQDQSRPLVDDLRTWLDAQLLMVPGRSRIAEAIRYALKLWSGLGVFLDDGRVEIDSNVVERSIRPLALNRRNALFAGSDQGGVHWGVIASLIETCKLNGVDPQAYLATTLTRLINRHPASQIDDLMPWAHGNRVS